MIKIWGWTKFIYETNIYSEPISLNNMLGSGDLAANQTDMVSPIGVSLLTGKVNKIGNQIKSKLTSNVEKCYTENE